MMTHSLECQQGVGVKFILKIRADKFGINFHYICIESNENFVHNYELIFTSLINNLFQKKITTSKHLISQLNLLYHL